MTDSTEGLRRTMQAAINTVVSTSPSPRELLEGLHGKNNVFDSSQLTEQFEVLGFFAPLVVVRRRSDGRMGSLMFSHQPRLYFGWQEDK